MKKKILVMATFAITIFILNANSFSQDKNYFALLIGRISFPVGDFSYGYKPGFNIEGRLGVKTSRTLRTWDRCFIQYIFTQTIFLDRERWG